MLDVSFDFDGISFTGATMEEWRADIDAVIWTGVTYAVRFGPFPFKPDENTVNNYGTFMRHYGKQTHHIIYGDRSIVVGRALVLTLKQKS